MGPCCAGHGGRERATTFAARPQFNDGPLARAQIPKSEIRMTPQPVTGEVLAGVVERVTYHNAENGFCVLRARARGHRDVVTVVGHAAAISAGDERRFDPGLDNSCISRCASPSQADAIQALTSTSCPGHSVAA